ncbi:MAG: type II toxin-antitoxin system RelE/ParE family toxin [Chromatiaceae bacterium]|jgi:hypothetical protein|nr:type II toxin-antitoxin system RelE/ParE family toxin [Chromatiaceae bacterium]
MAVARISFAESALGDLAGIQEWYRAGGVPQFGQRFLRELIHPPFRIVHRRDARRARIPRVWRSEPLLRLPTSVRTQDPAG